MTLLQRVLSHAADYRFAVDTLGPCTLPSPVRNRAFVADGACCALTDDDDNGAPPVRTRQTGPLPAFERAGPRRHIFHDPSWSRAAIVTAGGLCPGLNHVIKGLVEILRNEYGVPTIYGIRYGYRGLMPQQDAPPVLLDTEAVDTIHEHGGTILGSSRGAQPVGPMVDTLTRMNINLLFCVGGDGTLRGARDIAEECGRRKLPVSVVGIPKTVDNDLHFVGNSFGFATAVGETSAIIQSAHMEAKGARNGLGLVKLMGRDSGFIAAYAALANPVVNFCLIPECAFTLDGPGGLIEALEKRFAAKDHAVIVVAEGAGQELIADEPERRDASGNVLKKDIGEFLRRALPALLARRGVETAMKYFDPSYSIRSVPAKGIDAIHCYLLARHAVHAAMAGRTNCVVGHRHGDVYALVPIALAALERQQVNPDGDLWKAVLDATGQDRWLRTPPGHAMNAPPQKRCCMVGVVGRTNAGKSTLVNRFVGEKISIVSPVVQTTRHTIRGIYTDARGQIVLVDTPGLHRAEGRLGTLLNRMARHAAANVEALLVVFDGALPPHIEDDGWMRRALFAPQPVIFALNKADDPSFGAARFHDLWERVQTEKAQRRDVAWFPVSAATGAGLSALMDALFALATPSAALLFDADTVTDHPRRLAIADVVREKLFTRLHDEMPHEIGVLVDDIREADGAWDITVTILVNRGSQKGIVIGPKGRLLRAVKRAAEPEIGAMFDVKAKVELWVKIEPNWSRNIWRLRQMGYMGEI